MKKCFGILFVLFLFLYCFVFNGSPACETKIYENNSNSTKNLNKNNPVKKTNLEIIENDSPVEIFINSPYEFNSPSNKSNSMACKFLIEKINLAKKSIDYAIYGISGQTEFINAIINASKRGVLVRGVVDSNEKGLLTFSDSAKLKPAGIISYDKSSDIMHNKFLIIDDEMVFTGSMNISNTGCGGYNANISAVVTNPKIVSAYKNEFEQMGLRKFKKDKQNFSVENESGISVYFSPVGNVYENAILPLVKSAKNKIRISIFSFTYKPLADELVNKAKNGVKIYVIIDALGAENNKKLINYLRENNIKVKVENWGGKNHEKTISIDNNVLITGSANFSYSGFFNNDENVLVFKNNSASEFYNEYFDKIYDSIDEAYLYKFPDAEGAESKNSCSDGIDNDFNGKIDFEDSKCNKD